MFDKLMVLLSRNWGKVRHEPLKVRLAVNRGKALGHPKPLPKTRQQQRAASKRMRLRARDGSPF